ncbi:MAG TPA: hypothetical protein VFX03_16795 [Thermomicrobiales bacterium]|nr:hypothetical protein [Thermomicrobiales bacterium]
MPALSADRNTPRAEGGIKSLAVGAAKLIYAGALVMRNATGFAVPGAVATTLIGVGRADERVDNSAGADGDLSVRVRTGVFRFANSAAADAITAADIGKPCYAVDDQTVAKTDGTATRSIAGFIFDVDDSGVWVEFDEAKVHAFKGA